MPTFEGNTSTSAVSTAKNIPATIISFSLVNKTNGTITVSVSLLFGSSNIYIYSGTIAANATYTDSTKRILPTGDVLYVLTTGSLDYFFSITGINDATI